MPLKICKKCKKIKNAGPTGNIEFYKDRATCIECYRDIANEKKAAKTGQPIVKKNNTKRTRAEGIIILNKNMKRELKKKGETPADAIIITPGEKQEKKVEDKPKKQEDIIYDVEKFTVSINSNNNIVLSFKN